MFNTPPYRNGMVAVSVTLPDGTAHTTQGQEYRLVMSQMATLLGVSCDFVSLRSRVARTLWGFFLVHYVQHPARHDCQRN
jgi:hypothetical protein